MEFKKYIIVLILGLMPFVSFSQSGEGNIWYFGQNAGLDFNSGAPVPLTNGQLNTQEGCATICDIAGNLLFYTDGITVWNANHVPMSNSLPGSPGGALKGDPSATQSGVIVPQPGSLTIYYIFTVDNNYGPNGCQYSIVDMSMNGGLGNVVLASKNTMLFTPSAEKITSVHHANGQSVWVIAHPWNSGNFFSYLVTTTGLVAAPVISTAGSMYSGNSAVTRGYLRSSPDGAWVGAGIEGLDQWELFTFNNTTGMLTPYLITPSNWSDAYGVEFSPDVTKMYGSRRWGAPIFQWDLTAGTPGLVQASMTQIGNLGGGDGGALGLAPDGKIYVARDNSNTLGVINDPNTGGPACGFVLNGVVLGNYSQRHCHEGLPTFISSFFNVADFEFQNQCFGDLTEFAIGDTNLLDSAFWYFDDPLSNPFTTSTEWFPIHIFTDAGLYDVTLITYRQGIGDTITYEIEIYPYPEIPLGPDTSICTGTSITLDAGNPGAEYLWNDGSTGKYLNVMPWDTTTYTVSVTSNECTAEDSITVMPFDITSNFIVSPITCYGDEVTVTYTGNASPYAHYHWNFGGANMISGVGAGPYVINWTNPGTFTVTLDIQQGTCVSGTSTQTLVNPPDLDIGITGNDVLCFGDATGEIFLSASGGDGLYSFIWDAGYNDQNLIGVPAGVYNVTVVYDVVCQQSATYTVNEPAAPLTTDIVGSSVQCFGETSGTIDLTPSGGTGPYTYSWSFNDETSQDLQGLGAGYYTVTVWDNHNCPATDGTSISSPAQIGITTSAEYTICDGQEATINAYPFGGTPNYTINWIGNGSGDSITVTPSSTTTYSVYAIDDNSCYSDTAYVTIGVFPPVYSLAGLGRDTICIGESTYIDASFSGGNGGPYTCLIDDELVTLPFAVTPDTSTTFLIKGQDNCESPAIEVTIEVIVLELPFTNIQSDIISGCQPLQIEFSNTNADEGLSYLWNFGENGDFGFSVEKDPTHIFDNAGIYDIGLTTTSSHGCVYTTRIPEMIEVFVGPYADLYAEKNKVSIQSPVVYFDNLSEDAVSSFWDFGDGVTLRSDFPVVHHIYTDTGMFNVTLLVESDKECFDTTTIYIEVYDEINFNAPNVFNPNSPNPANTVFKPSIYGVDADDYRMIIYDRWGMKIFESFSYYHGWDGKLKNGEFAKEGSYMWMVTYKDDRGFAQQESGSVLLLK